VVAPLDDDACVLCSQKPETTDHLFLGCVVTRQLWFALLSSLGLEAIAPNRDDVLVERWLRCRGLLAADSRPVLGSVLFLVTRCVWKERNNRTFNRITANLRAMVFAVLREAKDWIAVGISTISTAFVAWSQIQFTM
jgi:hypothetical protein